MSFTRTFTDPCAYKKTLEENVSYASYMLDPIRYDNCNKCRHELGIVGGTAVSHVKGNLIDLESNLFGIDRDLSRCPSSRFVPRGDQQVQGTTLYRDSCRPVVDTHMKHLSSCQMFDYAPFTPQPPPLDLFKCGKQ